MKKGLVLVGAFVGAVWGLQAEISLSRVFSDNMVLQRGKPVPVWGWAKTGATVSVSFAGQTKTVVANADGAWRRRRNSRARNSRSRAQC